ncbi:MAG: dihydrofolate reductase family protein [Acidimicrobiales bacterium]
MSRVRVHNFSVSLDGFGTGEGQSLEAPFGHAGQRLHEWFFPTRTFCSFHETQGDQGGSTGVDDAFASGWDRGIGAEISIEMKGGTTFHFIDASPAEAVKVAQEAAGGLDVRIGGGPLTIREFLAADQIDYMHVAIVPLVLGRGERLWDGLEGLESRFELDSVSSPSGVIHLTLSR